MQKPSLGILGSTRGTDLEAIISGIQQKKLSALIKVVVSNKEDAYILQRAKKHDLAAVFLSPANLTRDLFDQKISELMHAHEVDYIILIGYMRILSNEFVNEWRNKILNVHPSLLPAFKGGMDKDVYQRILASGVQETGCTVHLVTEELDGGPILVQKKCAVLPNDTVEILKNRVQALEGDALVEAIQELTQ
jgi:phosphoribosylglycinamide formyltransferase-1